MNNVYYDPEKFDLEIVAEHDCAGSYEFDMLVVWRQKGSGRLLWAQDSGCSCPTPFEDIFIDDMREVDAKDPDWLRAVENQGRSDSVSRFLDRVYSAATTPTASDGGRK